MSSVVTFPQKRTHIIAVGKKARMRIPEETHKGLTALCAANGYSKAVDALIYAVNHGLMVLGHLPGDNDKGVNKSEQV